jgi:hypothetical protein
VDFAAAGKFPMKPTSSSSFLARFRSFYDTFPFCEQKKQICRRQRLRVVIFTPPKCTGTWSKFDLSDGANESEISFSPLFFPSSVSFRPSN